MILSDIKDAWRYRNISPLIADAIDWLLGQSPDSFHKGTYTICCRDGREMIAKCEEPDLLPREKATLEAHRRFIDIQVPLKRTESMGWESYNADSDIAFFGDSAHSIVHVKVGQLAIFFPEDAHAPNIGLGNHRKLIIKVPVE